MATEAEVHASILRLIAEAMKSNDPSILISAAEDLEKIDNRREESNA